MAGGVGMGANAVTSLQGANGLEGGLGSGDAFNSTLLPNNAQALGMDLAEAGISVDCLPLLDVRQPGANDIIGDRALGSEPMRVAALGRAVLDGLASAGVAGVIKHIPGHGRAMADSHMNLPTVNASADQLETDIAPFRTLAAAPVAMTAHIVYTAWDAENPATQSAYVVGEVIRRHIGFDGLLLTDDLDMAALSGSVPQRGARAIAAGCDIALNCWAKMDDMIGLASALPAITDDASMRLERALASTDVNAPDISAQAALLDARDTLLALADASGDVSA